MARCLNGSAATVHAGPTGGLARASIHDDDGRLIAEAIGHFRYLAGAPRPRSTPPPLPASMIAGPLLELFDVTVEQFDDGIGLQLEAGPKAANPLNNLHGGMSLCLSEVAAMQAARSESESESASDRVNTTSLHIAYLRPAAAQGTLRFTTEVMHRGRTLAIVRVRCLRPDGKAVSVATVTMQAGANAPADGGRIVADPATVTTAN